ncbi:hypothetical protein AGOR_G00113450 [Albula goreensis]|uniref:Uncharacterized protein n=1 Tax=Albula goreensis TaxID=1534307 RepID=A0A8T3DFG6_9TELE|nr:hypothetical protein AGOR_G00113450 [Albula goreensis]
MLVISNFGIHYLPYSVCEVESPTNDVINDVINGSTTREVHLAKLLQSLTCSQHGNPAASCLGSKLSDKSGRSCAVENGKNWQCAATGGIVFFQDRSETVGSNRWLTCDQELSLRKHKQGRQDCALF